MEMINKTGMTTFGQITCGIQITDECIIKRLEFLPLYDFKFEQQVVEKVNKRIYTFWIFIILGCYIWLLPVFHKLLLCLE